ncbi:hypothetical protein [Flavobacterium sp. JP2137]|uniref:hypothetical protein n=1 Tax=Flavobacterium sp. JP2137 TaxID=3414510 RepID=UPI003D2FED1D
MKKYNRYNFFKHTFCEFREVMPEELQEKLPNYKSASGSEYYFDQEGVYRYANHWGRAANCRWRLLGSGGKQNGYHWGYALWTDFFPNNDTEKLFFVQVDWQAEQVSYQHHCKRQTEYEQRALLRSALDTAKVVKQIKELFASDDWAKYLGAVDIISTRTWIIGELITTNTSLINLKKELLHGTKK